MASNGIEKRMPGGATNISIVVVIVGNYLKIVIAAYRVKQVAWVRVDLRSMRLKCGTSTELNLFTSANLNLDNEVKSPREEQM